MPQPGSERTLLSYFREPASSTSRCSTSVAGNSCPQPSRTDCQAKRVGAIQSALIHQSIEVFWPEEKEWFPGVVKCYDSSTGAFEICYADGTSVVQDLAQSRYRTVRSASNDENPGRGAAGTTTGAPIGLTSPAQPTSVVAVPGPQLPGCVAPMLQPTLRTAQGESNARDPNGAVHQRVEDCTRSRSTAQLAPIFAKRSKAHPKRNAAAASLKTDCAKKSPRSKETQSTFTAALTKREVTQVHPAVEPSKFAVNKIHKYFSSKFYYVYPITFSGSSCDPLIEELSETY